MSLDDQERFEDVIEARDATITTLRAKIARLEKDAACFVWCQNNPKRAQALMWNTTSRTQRKAAILHIIEQERLFVEALDAV